MAKSDGVVDEQRTHDQRGCSQPELCSGKWNGRSDRECLQNEHSLFSENGEHHISNLSDPQLPAAVENLVTGITGTNDFAPRHMRS